MNDFFFSCLREFSLCVTLSANCESLYTRCNCAMMSLTLTSAWVLIDFIYEVICDKVWSLSWLCRYQKCTNSVLSALSISNLMFIWDSQARKSVLFSWNSERSGRCLLDCTIVVKLWLDRIETWSDDENESLADALVAVLRAFRFAVSCSIVHCCSMIWVFIITAHSDADSDKILSEAWFCDCFMLFIEYSTSCVHMQLSSDMASVF